MTADTLLDSPATETAMLALIRERFSAASGNGERYVFARHVRSHAGFDATRTADAVVMDVWPSSGLAVHGFEVKVSRSDWLRELKDPHKATPVRRFCDHWWLVVSDRSIVRPGELPDGWGLLAPALAQSQYVWDHEAGRFARRPGRQVLRQVVAAPKLAPEPMTRSFYAALLRAATRTAREARA
jgi:hypothetical protein